MNEVRVIIKGLSPLAILAFFVSAVFLSFLVRLCWRGQSSAAVPMLVGGRDR